MSEEPSYLWNWYRTRKHISTGDAASDYTGNGQRTLCGQNHRDKDQIEAALLRWNIPERVKVLLDRMEDVPLCKKCEKKAAPPVDLMAALEASLKRRSPDAR